MLNLKKIEFFLVMSIIRKCIQGKQKLKDIQSNQFSTNMKNLVLKKILMKIMNFMMKLSTKFSKIKDNKENSLLDQLVEEQKLQNRFLQNFQNILNLLEKIHHMKNCLTEIIEL